jgi:hypothetical protein
VDHAATYPTDVKTLHLMLDEQRQLIESLKANLHRLLKWKFGPKSEHINIDQLGLFGLPPKFRTSTKVDYAAAPSVDSN